ncbi:uncharacterized protein LOC116294801, partial [Actinia tenebrosa]|uniref:Uncharacterized protein LOC116294801 n=1 Tax=Actinia tenebrosa TaxID=6105 RepID=A0A6P8HPM0_ACTTE
MAVLSTGFGKSLRFRVFVEAMEIILQRSVSVFIVCPMVGIEQDQILEAESLGITCCSLKKLKMAADTKLIFASAEEIQNPEFRKLLKNPNSILNTSLELIVIDESHTTETAS